jgi:RimJ/RimL family protein N-acetyltransferase
MNEEPPDQTNRDIWQGDRVRLRVMEPSDWETIFEWDKDSEMARNAYLIPFPRSREATKQWAEREALRGAEDESFHWVIENLEGEPVGRIITFDCQPRHGTFKYGLAIAPEHQRKGYASEAVYLVLRFYFLERRYQKVTVNVYSFNETSIGFHKNLGFQHEGTLRRMSYTNGQYWDDVMFGMTAEEFAQKFGSK